MKLAPAFVLLLALSSLATAATPAPAPRLAGAKAHFIGDSITRGGRSYVATVKETLSLEAVGNYGISGGALCRRITIPRFKNRLFRGEKRIDDAYSPVVDRWQDMEGDADILFMLIGTNDYNSRVPLGDPESAEASEFNGGLNIVLGGLRGKYPDARIIVSTILRRRGGGNLGPYNAAIQSAAKRHGIHCFDAHNAPGLDFEADFQSGKKRITHDGLHPNPEGHRLLGKRIAEYILALQSERAPEN